MPFVHLERDLWDLRDAAGQEIGPDAPERCEHPSNTS
jgi:putative restriction endonuclease